MKNIPQAPNSVASIAKMRMKLPPKQRARRYGVHCGAGAAAGSQGAFSVAPVTRSIAQGEEDGSQSKNVATIGT